VATLYVLVTLSPLYQHNITKGSEKLGRLKCARERGGREGQREGEGKEREC